MDNYGTSMATWWKEVLHMVGKAPQFPVEALKKAQLSPEAEKIAQRELRRLQNIQPHHPEHSVCRSYLAWEPSAKSAKLGWPVLKIFMGHGVMMWQHFTIMMCQETLASLPWASSSEAGFNSQWTLVSRSDIFSQKHWILSSRVPKMHSCVLFRRHCRHMHINSSPSLNHVESHIFYWFCCMDGMVSNNMVLLPFRAYSLRQDDLDLSTAHGILEKDC